MNRGRPKLLYQREERLIIRTLHQLRVLSVKEEDPRRVALVPCFTLNHLQSVKGLLTSKDKRKRMKFALDTRIFPANYWTDTIAFTIVFYFDGVGFVHIRNPYAEARAVSSMA